MTRTYEKRERAVAQDARRARAIEAMGEILAEQGHDAVTLQAVADRAGISLKSVVRYFGTREGMFEAAMRESVSAEEGARGGPMGSVPAVVAVLGGRYREMADWVVRNGHAEFRSASMATWIAASRRSHREWLAHAFGPWLPGEGPVREARLDALFWGTELRCWWGLSVALGRGPEAADAAMSLVLEALVASWALQPKEG